ncbi:MAG: rod shape-determining protein MreD [Candidatus Doudnabacteria bacterium]|nr:rod shape-determining protein MreD [Candidatus Doudnabacteria bacterium]
MKYLILGIGIFILTVVQTALAQNFSINQVFPNFMLMLLVIVSIYASFHEALAAALLAGMLADFVSALPDGVMTISFLILVMAIRLAGRLFSEKKENFLAQAGVMLAAVVAYYFLAFFVSEIFARLGLGASFSLVDSLKKIWLEAILDLIVLYPVYLYYLLVSKLMLRYAGEKSI